MLKKIPENNQENSIKVTKAKCKNLKHMQLIRIKPFLQKNMYIRKKYIALQQTITYENLPKKVFTNIFSYFFNNFSTSNSPSHF